MIHAYDEIYLGKAQMTLAWMFDYAVNGCRIDVEEFYRMFLTSAYVHRFEKGNCSVVAGLSGVELAQRVIWERTPDEELPQPVFSLARSPEYGLDEMRACHQKRQVARLQEYRKRVPLSQKELAEKADVPLRTIQQYEQKQKNINHARADYVIRLAKALYCSPEDLLELETLQ